ncbi:MAG TPA: hypothetical protein VIX14_04725 [Terriglobales bacterium]
MFGKAFGKLFGKTFIKMTVVGHALLTVVLGSSALLGQATSAQASPGQVKPAAPNSQAAIELPVTMRQNVAAGKATVGTKVQAKLAVATLVDGVVVPRDAVFSGEVTESVARSANTPSRLAIRMDSAQWKNGAAPIVLSLAPKVYLTAWYYPVATPTNQDFSPSLPDAANHPRPLGGTGVAYPGPRNPTAPPVPGPDPGRDRDTGLKQPSNISQHRVLMKNVESTRSSEGAVILTSQHSNIKLDKSTTYVLAAGDLLPTKEQGTR